MKKKTEFLIFRYVLAGIIGVLTAWPMAVAGFSDWVMFPVCVITGFVFAPMTKTLASFIVNRRNDV